MAQDSSPRPETSVATLIGGIVNDAKDLLINEFTIAKLEIQQEMRKTKSAAISFAMGAGIVGIGGLFLLLMCVHGLVILLDIPLWGSYGLVGGLLFLVGAILLVRGKQTAEQIDVIPPKTASTLRDNAQWIKEQTTSNRV
jgi:Putative Actinobacterial Holin-X, holin superfamily III